MNKLVISFIFSIVLAQISFANGDGCVDCNSSQKDINSVFYSFDNFCSDIKSLNRADNESDRIKKIAKIDDFQYVQKYIDQLSKNQAKDMLTRLETVDHEFDQAILKRKQVMDSLKEEMRSLSNEITNLEAAKSSISLLDQYVNEKLCDGNILEGSRRGIEICQAGKWVSAQ